MGGRQLVMVWYVLFCFGKGREGVDDYYIRYVQCCIVGVDV